MEDSELDSKEHEEIIFGAENLFIEIYEEAKNVKDYDLVDPSEEMGLDEKFLDYMDTVEKRFFYLFIYYKLEKQEIKMEKIKIALMTLIRLRLLDKKIDFPNCSLHLRKGFKIVAKEEKLVSYAKKID